MERLHKALLAFMWILVLCASGWSQSITTGSMRTEIRGQVRYSNGQPGEQGILVTLTSRNGGGVISQIQTDQQGKFEITDVPPAVYIVTIHQPGYLDQAQGADLSTMPTAYVLFSLIPLPGKAQPAAGAAGSITPVSAAELALPSSTREEFEQGRKLLKEQNDAKGSVPHFQKVIQEAPSFAEAHLLLGTAKMDLRQWKDAEAVLKETVSLDDKSGPAFLALGTCYIEEHKFAEAEKPLLRGLELDPQASLGHYELASAYWSLNRWQDAAPYAHKSVELNPDFPPAHVLLGNVMLRERNARGALKEFKEYLRLDPKGPLSSPTKEIVGKIEKALAAAH